MYILIHVKMEVEFVGFLNMYLDSKPLILLSLPTNQIHFIDVNLEFLLIFTTVFLFFFFFFGMFVIIQQNY